MSVACFLVAAMFWSASAWARDAPETFRQLRRAFEEQHYDTVAEHGPALIRKGLPADELLETKRMVDASRFQLAVKEGTDASLSRYLSQEPNGTRLRDARQRLCDIREAAFGRVDARTAPRVEEWLLVCANTTRWSQVKVALAELHRAEDADDASGQLVEVRVTGTGTTLDEALRNGWQGAVSNVVGVLVDSETVVQNGQLIQDKVLTQSAGFVQSYKQGTVRAKDGLVEVEMTVAVRKTRLGLVLKRSGVAARTVDGSVYATAVTKARLASDTRKLMLKYLEPVFDGSLLRMSLEGAAEPELTPLGAFKLDQELGISIDGDAYAAMTASLREVVEGVAIRREEIFCDISGMALQCNATSSDEPDAVRVDIFRASPDAGDRVRGTRYVVPRASADLDALQRLRFDGGTVFRVGVRAIGANPQDVVTELAVHIGERATPSGMVARENTLPFAAGVALYPERTSRPSVPQHLLVMDRFMGPVRASPDFGTYTLESGTVLSWRGSFVLSEKELARVRTVRTQLSVVPR
jgi:hypothetical protein